MQRATLVPGGEYGYGAFGADDLYRLYEALLRPKLVRSSSYLTTLNAGGIRAFVAYWHSHRVDVRRQIAGFRSTDKPEIAKRYYQIRTIRRVAESLERDCQQSPGGDGH